MTGTVDLKSLAFRFAPHVLSVAVVVGMVKTEFTHMKSEIALVRDHQMKLAVYAEWMKNSDSLHDEFIFHMRNSRKSVANLWTSGFCPAEDFI